MELTMWLNPFCYWLQFGVCLFLYQGRMPPPRPPGPPQLPPGPPGPRLSSFLADLPPSRFRRYDTRNITYEYMAFVYESVRDVAEIEREMLLRSPRISYQCALTMRFFFFRKACCRLAFQMSSVVFMLASA